MKIPFSDLKSVIADKIKKEGAITFAEFMSHALYNSKWGYYQKGKRDDYYTAPQISSIFGEMLAKLFSKLFKRFNERELVLMEIGAGVGYLARDILLNLEKRYLEDFNYLKYIPLEISDQKMEELKRYLAKDSLDKYLYPYKKEIKINGIIFSNEFFDALPVHIVKMDKGRLKEIYVEYKNEEFIEVVGEVSTDEILSYFEELKIELFEGQRAEVNLEAIRWLNKISKLLEKGFLITIDYGDLSEKLYSFYQIDGTIRSFYLHQVSKSPYINIGEQDITANVNFSALIYFGEKYGFNTLSYLTQKEFLINLGILDSIDPSDFSAKGIKDKLAIKNLIVPEVGMGEVFKVLIQSKGIGRFSIKDLWETK